MKDLLGSHYLTVGELKKNLENLPDDMPVLIQRIEDFYFEKNGWKTITMLWEWFADTAPETSDYIVAFDAYKASSDEDNTEEAFVINAHY